MTNLNFTVDKNKCTKCGKCVNSCISCIISLDTDNYPTVQDETNCIKCQHCMTSCPVGAISVFNKNPEHSEHFRKSVNPEDLLNLMKNRRSCRHYKHENISVDKMNKLKEMLNYVPTGCNYRGLHFSIIENVKKMDQINNLVNNKLKTVVKFLPTSGMLKRLKPLILSGKDVVFRNAPHMIVISVDKKSPCKSQDPIIALSYFELLAQSLGLGTLWCGFATGTLPMSKDAMKMLEIPKTHKIGYVMMFGEPEEIYHRSTQPEAYGYSIIK